MPPITMPKSRMRLKSLGLQYRQCKTRPTSLHAEARPSTFKVYGKLKHNSFQYPPPLAHFPSHRPSSSAPMMLACQVVRQVNTSHWTSTRRTSETSLSIQASFYSNLDSSSSRPPLLTSTNWPKMTCSKETRTHAGQQSTRKSTQMLVGKSDQRSELPCWMFGLFSWLRRDGKKANRW